MQEVKKEFTLATMKVRKSNSTAAEKLWVSGPVPAHQKTSQGMQQP